MPKLFWVTLPLLAALAVLGWLWLGRRPPSRHAINVWSSLLLLAYVAATAALGIFWVARQQLPVFDWHYLFGYATVLLLALHLWFNFGAAWRFLTRRRAAAARSLPQSVGRRRWLATSGVVASGAAAYLLGLQQGRRNEPRFPGRGPKGDAGPNHTPTKDDGLAMVERFHAQSAHSRSDVLTQAPPLSLGSAPPPFKHYPQLPRIPLPPPTSPSAWPHLGALGIMLWHVAGPTDKRVSLNLRAAPSSGALFPAELYVASWEVDGLPPGLWHYDARHHALERLKGHGLDEDALGVSGALVHAAALVIVTSVFRRTSRKYHDRTYRYVLADLGHGLENLRVAATATGAAPRLLMRFDESRVAATMGIEESEEGVIALVALPKPGSPPFSAVASCMPPSTLAFARPAGEENQVFGEVTEAIHQASSLRIAALAPAQPPPARPGPLQERTASLPSPPSARKENLLAVIAARRSVRRFSQTPVTLEALAGVLAGMAEPSLLSSAVRIDVIVNAVLDVAPGAYRYDPSRHLLLPRRVPRELRAAAQAAALGQDVIGGAAAVLVLSIDRAAFAADACGPARGYRHAFLEAGMMGERVYLQAGARGLGTCAVGAFYDEEAATLVGIDSGREWVVHFAALGIPAR